MLAGRPKAEQTACRSYGMNLGIAFQLIDDALDYSGKSAKLGKNVGDDFREGKITLPVVLSFRRGSEARTRLLESHARQRRNPRGRLENAMALMVKHRAIEDTVEPRAPLRRDRDRRVGAGARFGDEAGTARSGRVLHRPRALTVSLTQRRFTDPPFGALRLQLARRRGAPDRPTQRRQSRLRPSPTYAPIGNPAVQQADRGISRTAGTRAVAARVRSLPRSASQATKPSRSLGTSRTASAGAIRFLQAR